MTPPPGILYLSYDGMLEPLGQSQVLAYLERLAPAHRIHLISFEKRADWDDAARRGAVAERMARAGIAWTPLRYHKAPSAPATAYDIAVGTVAALAVALRHRVAVVHARSYVPGLMALAVKRLTGARFVFDMRGFWGDERVDGGLWPRGGVLYRTVKRLERTLLASADHVVTLTEAAVREMRGWPSLRDRLPPMTVIPTCADLALFTRGERPAGPFTFGYVGSAGTWYLFEEVAACFRMVRARRPDARLLLVNRHDHALMRRVLDAAGVDPGAVEIVAAEHREVPALVRRMHAAASLILPAYSKIASAPTKLAEYLGCGVPCLGNAGVGDVREVLEAHRCGVAVAGVGEAELAAGVDALLALADDPETPARCAEAAAQRFSLEVGVARYRAIYQALGGGAPPAGGR